MRIFTVILLALIINPAVANGQNLLYQKSKGYERSTIGYNKSTAGYNKSTAHSSSKHGYQKSEKGYTPNRKADSYRVNERKYVHQLRKSKQEQKKWVEDRHNEYRHPNVRNEFRQSGGVRDNTLSK